MVTSAAIVAGSEGRSVARLRESSRWAPYPGDGAESDGIGSHVNQRASTRASASSVLR